MEQNQIWLEHTKNTKLEDLISAADQPAEFQLELKSVIDSFKNHYKSILEVGCGTGITSLIIDDNFEKTLLDLNPLAIELVKSVFDKFGKKADFVVSDMFKMDFKDKKFDIVFNAGVIEHFNFNERVKAIKEYNQVLKDNGIMIIAYPNHYSIPYRMAYLYFNLLKKWTFPKEYKLHDLKKEIQKNGLVLEKRILLAKQTPFQFLHFSKIIKNIFLMLDKFFDFEGYLTVLIIRKH